MIEYCITHSLKEKINRAVNDVHILWPLPRNGEKAEAFGLCNVGSFHIGACMFHSGSVILSSGLGIPPTQRSWAWSQMSTAGASLSKVHDILPTLLLTCILYVNLNKSICQNDFNQHSFLSFNLYLLNGQRSLIFYVSLASCFNCCLFFLM